MSDMEQEPGKVERPLLNQYQAQGITVSLRMLERILFSLDELSHSAPVSQGTLVTITNPITEEQKARLDEMSGRAREIIRWLAYRFALKHETADLARELHGRLVEMWATLEDARSHKLRGYGEVNPLLAAELDPGMEELIGLVLAMDHELMRRKPASGTVPALTQSTEKTGATETGLSEASVRQAKEVQDS